MKALIAMGIWTLTIGYILYSLDAHLHYREIKWAFILSIVLLSTHMINLVIYFRVAGNDPYRWVTSLNAHSHNKRS